MFWLGSSQDTLTIKRKIFNKNLIFCLFVPEYSTVEVARHCHQTCKLSKKKDNKMPKLKTKSYLKKRASMTATGKIRVARNSHKKLLRKKSARANKAGAKPQYLNDNMVGQAKILAPYGLK
jgi:ribosomal protein L35